MTRRQPRPTIDPQSPQGRGLADLAAIKRKRDGQQGADIAATAHAEFVDWDAPIPDDHDEHETSIAWGGDVTCEES